MAFKMVSALMLSLMTVAIHGADVDSDPSCSQNTNVKNDEDAEDNVCALQTQMRLETKEEEFHRKMAQLSAQLDVLLEKDASIEDFTEVLNAKKELRQLYNMREKSNIKEEDYIQGIVEHLEQARGLHGAQFKFCKQVVKDVIGDASITDDYEKSLHALTSKCRENYLGKFANVDCSRLENQMLLQRRIHGDQHLTTPDSFCAIVVDVALPIDEEPECMGFAEDLSHLVALAAAETRKGHESWPRIVEHDYFDEAFSDACKMRNLSQCDQALGKVKALDWTGGIVEVLAEMCTTIGLPIPEESPSQLQQTPLFTARSMFREAFRKNGRYTTRGKKASSSHHRSASDRHGLVDRDLLLSNFSAKKRDSCHCEDCQCADWCYTEMAPTMDPADLQFMCDTFGPGTPPGRYGVPCEDCPECIPKSDHGNSGELRRSCCDEEAHTHEVNFEISAGVSIATGASWGYGHDKFFGGDQCQAQEQMYANVCTGAGPDVGVDLTYVHGFFFTFSNIAGFSEGISGGVCYYACLGGGGIWNNGKSKLLGRFVELGVGFGADVTFWECIARETSCVEKSTHHCPSSGPLGISACFPGDAVVETPQGPKNMRTLQVGDEVLAVDNTGRTYFDQVYFFGHADGKNAALYKKLELGDASLSLSLKHFIQVCPQHGQTCEFGSRIHSYAKDVHPGDHVWVSSGGTSSQNSLRLRKVLATSVHTALGAYNPYTLSGNIVVNGVVGSAHSDWVLDEWTPACWVRYLPAMYQALFFPGRWLYHLAGPAAASALDVNNPQTAPETYGHGPLFLLVCCFVSLSIGGLGLRKGISKAS